MIAAGHCQLSSPQLSSAQLYLAQLNPTHQSFEWTGYCENVIRNVVGRAFEPSALLTCIGSIFVGDRLVVGPVLS